MNYTNLNIYSTKNSFSYIVEYYDDPTIDTTPLQYYKDENNIFFVNNTQTNVVSKKNYWYNEYNESTGTHQKELQNDYVPVSYNKSSFNIYFPRFSVETYENNLKYVLTLNTWVNGKYVYLGSYLLDSNQAKACETGPKKFLNTEYYEYIHIDTIDPVYLIYGDEWKDFRVNVCGEKDLDGVQANNTASNINITLNAVKNYDDYWLKLDEYNSSQSALLLSNSINNYLHTTISFDFDEGKPEFICNVNYNSLYSSLSEYLLETYQLKPNDLTSKFVLIYKDKNDIYRAISHEEEIQESTVFKDNEIEFSSWDEYQEGITVSAIYSISKGDDEILIFSSNELMLSEELFKYLIHSNTIKKVNFDNLTDMTTNHFDVVNIIENQIVTVERQDDYKANLIKPVFVKVQEASALKLHTSVTENIVLNLDAYKNKVDSFVIKIGDTNFYEIGRINTGIIFKIVGSNLSSADAEGTYYVLNEDGDLVTTGNYTLV